jgi:glycosyltransferase involved in cell wall biosynthesis
MRVLIISAIYAPDTSPRAYRWSAIAEHWAARGHTVDVVAAWKPGDARDEIRNGVTVHRVGGMIERLRARLGGSSHRAVGAAPAPAKRQSLLRGIANSVYALTLKQLFWPDYAFHWYPAAKEAALRLCRENRYDAMISVSHPFTAHLVGRAVKQSNPQLHWIVDIGDPFSLLDEIALNNRMLYGALNRRAEQSILTRSDAIAVTVERCRRDYLAAFEILPEKITVIPPLLSLPSRAAAQPKDPFPPGGRHLVFIGTLYRALRDPSPLLALFAALRARRPDLHLHFFGAVNDCAPCFAGVSSEIGRSIHLHGMVERDAVTAAMQAADILVNIGNSTPHQLPSKLVEYAAAAKPILNLAASDADSASDFLAEYPAALTLRLRGTEPDTASVEAALAFVAAPPAIDAAAADRFLAPYRIDRIAVAYETLIDAAASRPLRQRAV